MTGQAWRGGVPLSCKGERVWRLGTGLRRPGDVQCVMPTRGGGYTYLAVPGLDVYGARVNASLWRCTDGKLCGMSVEARRGCFAARLCGRREFTISEGTCRTQHLVTHRVAVPDAVATF